MNQPGMDATAVLLANTWQTMAMVGGLLIVILLVLWNAQKRARASEKGRTTPSIRERLHPSGDREKLKDDMQRLLAEMLETTRDIDAQLETRFRKLDVLIAQADYRIAQLTRLQQNAGPDEPAAGAEKPAAAHGSKKPSKRKGARTIGGKHDAEADAAAPAGDGSPVNPEHQGVYRLADDGLDARQIAVELGKSVGEIELILALRKK